jgi:hypothetical protein
MDILLAMWVKAVLVQIMAIYAFDLIHFDAGFKSRSGLWQMPFLML